MKNLTSTSAVTGLSTPDQFVDLDLSTTDPIVSGAQASPGQADSMDSLSMIVPVTEDLIRLLTTDCIRIGSMPNRANDGYESINFDELCASINSVGRNTQPIHVRALTTAEIQADTTHQYELISGERRLRACIECGISVRALIVSKSQSKSYEMDALIENLHRADLSPFEFGRQILHVLAADTGLSLRRLALKLGRDVSIVSRARDIALLPPEVIAAFASCSDIRYSDAKPLSDAVAAARAAAIAEAVRISCDRKALKPAEIVALIVAAAKHAAVLASGQNSAGGAGDESPERPTSSRKLICAEREVGSLKLDSKGRVQINLLLTLTTGQQGVLAQQIETFIQRKVFRIAEEKKINRHAVALDGVDNVDVVPVDSMQGSAKKGGVA